MFQFVNCLTKCPKFCATIVITKLDDKAIQWGSEYWTFKLQNHSIHVQTALSNQMISYILETDHHLVNVKLQLMVVQILDHSTIRQSEN